MAKLKAQRELKMKQRRARMAAKEAGSTKRAFSDSTIKKQASEVYKKALEQGGGAFAAKKRREFLKDAQYKMDTKSTVTPRNKPKPPAKTSTPTVTSRNKPKPPMDTTNQATIDDLREGITSGSDYSNTLAPRNKPKSSTVTPRNKPKSSTKTKPRGGGLSQMFGGAEGRREARRAKDDKEFAEYQERQENRLENQRKKAFANMEKQNEDIKDFFNKNILGRKTQLKSGGRVKKGYKKGCSVKKGYKSGGKVRGAGCVTKGVRPCKMR